MDMVGSLERVLGDARSLVNAASTDDLGKQTPCSDWTVGALIEHMTNVVKNFGNGFSGEGMAPPAPPSASTTTGESASAAYGQAVDRLVAAIKAPGALDKTLKLAFGEMPGQAPGGMAVA